MNTNVSLEFWVYFRSSDTTKITELGRSLWLPGFFHAALVSKFQNTKQIFKATNRVALMFPQFPVLALDQHNSVDGAESLR